MDFPNFSGCFTSGEILGFGMCLYGWKGREGKGREGWKLHDFIFFAPCVGSLLKGEEG